MSEIQDLKALLTAFIDAVGYDVEEIKSGLNPPQNLSTYKITKRPKQQPIAKQAKEDYTESFNEAWKPYPKREGGNSKIEAYRAWNARLNESKELTNEAQLMIAGVNRYAAYVKAKGIDGSEYVKQARTFFGPDKHYMDAWELPKVRHDAIKLPAMDDDLMPFAAKNGLSQPRMGEKFPEYRKRLSSEVAKLNK